MLICDQLSNWDRVNSVSVCVCVYMHVHVCFNSHLFGETSMSEGLLATMVGEMAGMGKRVVVMRPRKSSTSR